MLLLFLPVEFYQTIPNNVTTYEDSKNHSAMSFASKEAVVVFLSLLSGINENDIKSTLRDIYLVEYMVRPPLL